MESIEQLEQLESLCKRLEEERPASWDSLPDIPLYMDQVVAYLRRQLITFGAGDSLTSAMINNYIKDGLVPRANGKKYDREHLARLTAVAAVKQVLSVRDMKALLNAADAARDARESYEGICAELDVALREALGHIQAFPNQKDLPALALTLALRSYADALACRRIVELLRSDEDRTAKKKKHKDEELAL